MLQSKYIPKIGQKYVKLFFCISYLFGCLNTGYAQTQEWIYIARSTEGRYYIKRKIDRLPGGNPAIWLKIVSDDGSEQISYTEWDCKNRRFRLNQTSTYAVDGTSLEQLRNLDWAAVTPETVAEDLFEETCGTPRQIKYAMIILSKVQLRDAPRADGQVYRTVKRNEKFPLAPFNPVGAWYQIYDPKTLAEYWVHGNGIKIISNAEKSDKSNKKNSRRTNTAVKKKTGNQQK